MADKVTMAREWLSFPGNTTSDKTQKDEYDCLTVFIKLAKYHDSFSICALSLFYVGSTMLAVVWSRTSQPLQYSRD